MSSHLLFRIVFQSPNQSIPLSSDLLSIPNDLRFVLEKCLGEEPSLRTLDRYLPKVRTVLYRLLQGLQRKQAPYWRAVEDSRWVVPAVEEFARYR